MSNSYNKLPVPADGAFANELRLRRGEIEQGRRLRTRARTAVEHERELCTESSGNALRRFGRGLGRSVGARRGERAGRGLEQG